MDADRHQLAALDACADLLVECLRPPALMSVSEWADANRVLSGKASSEPGRWRTDRTPYLRQIMDDLSATSEVQEVVVMFAAQLGKSECGNNWLGYIIDHEPGPVMCVQPTVDMAKRFSRQRILPMLEDTPALKRRLSDNRSRDEANTMLLKDFRGGVLVISGGNSAAALRSMPVRYLFLDEIDAYPLDVDGEGDPVALAEKRTSTYSRRKVLKTSTPTVKDFSRIESAYLQTNRCEFFVPCPHCGEYQTLTWGADTPHGLKWRKHADGAPDLDSAHYVCAHCGAQIDEHHKTVMLAAGEWRARQTAVIAGRATGYHLSALYAPLGWVRWAELIHQWHTALTAAKHGDVTRLKAFANTALGETWEERGDSVATSDLARRAEAYPCGTVPYGGLLLTMGVDVQADRLEYRLWAWGRGQESWLIERAIIYGDPALDEGRPGSPWDDITARLTAPVPHAHGNSLPIRACAIDTGGHHTQQVYAYTRAHQHRNVLSVKGSSLRGKSVLSKPTEIDLTWRGQRVPRGVKLWIVGTDIAKMVLYGRMRLAVAGPGYMHVPAELAKTDEFEQLTAERLSTRYVGGRPRLEWIKPAGRRNEALDCAVYAYAAAIWCGVERYTEAQWRQLERSIAPATPAALAAPTSPEPAPPATAAQIYRSRRNQPVRATW